MKQKDGDESITQAEHKVKRANDEVEHALDHLEEKLEDGVQKVAKLKNAAKNPFILIGMATAVGLFFGKLLRIACRKKD